MMILLLLFFSMHAHAQKNKPNAIVEPITIEYKGKEVKAKKLTVSSEIPMDIDSAWINVKTPALLEFVAEGMIRFKPLGDGLPKQWEVGETYGVKMRVFGFIPFGGIHYLFIEKIDDENHTIASKEWDRGAKVWNHHVAMKDLGNGRIYYEDSITIYGGLMTGIITSFAKQFYKHRQKRWQIVAEESLNFDLE
ncbi:hypothetical protein [Mongoliitalea daihaiensis]|uniref:hypothetical protein n=1 Tax=Mongoliitalea daihaiensis TaxID=2782006 RepID=UPI001F36589A|nr:hypothetical protein [Mongoliitalea daihaiensis]